MSTKRNISSTSFGNKPIYISSVLNQCAEAVFDAKTLQPAVNACMEVLERTDVATKATMVKEILAFTSLKKLQFYIANALLKFEGLGVVNGLKTQDSSSNRFTNTDIE